MDIQYYGGNCVVLSNKGVRVVVDDNLAELGLKPILKQDDVAVYTGTHDAPKVGPRLLIDGPGEYEVSGLSITGISARAHLDPEGTHAGTMYKLVADDTSYLITGHVFPDLSEDQLEAIGTVDVMVVPVGGHGYTLDPTGAMQLIRKVEPKVAVPTHYAEDGIHYPVEQLALDEVLKNLGMEPKETVAKLRFKPAEVGTTTQLVLLSRS